MADADRAIIAHPAANSAPATTQYRLEPFLPNWMLLSLARSGYAPGWLGSVSATGVPLRAVAIASGGMAAAILLAVFAPANAFLALYGTAVAGMLFIWVVILLTYLRFRAALTPGQLARLPIRMPAHRTATWIAIVSQPRLKRRNLPRKRRLHRVRHRQPAT